MTEKRRWNAYVCPTCRLVFKFPADDDDRGACCPACHQLLQIPDQHSSAVESIPDDVTSSKGPKKIRKRRKRNRPKDNFSWEKENEPKLVRRGRRKRGAQVLMLLSILVTSALLAWFMLDQNKTNSSQTSQTVEVPAITSPPPAPKEAKPAEPDVPKIDPNFITDAEVLAGKFLSAQSVEELRPLVRNPDATIPRIMKLHPDGMIDMGGLHDFNPTEEIRKSDDFISVSVRTKDFADRTMIFVDTAEGIRIDWESWVGWCEMGWEEFMAAKPTTGTLFRVKLNKSNYFNFNFTDEKKWKPYILFSFDETQRLYGYVERDSAEAKKIAESHGPQDSFFTLSLKFPKDAATNNQVIIERVISNGWVVPTSPPP
ncbi:MAG: hypothetical protein ACO3F7_02930 [Luteolibacter sp.]